MTMSRSIEGLRGLGEHDLAEQIAGIRQEFARRHPNTKDIPLTGKLPQLQTARSEITLPPLSAETQKLVEHMTRDGYAVYETVGKTPAGVRGEGMKFRYLNPKLEDVSSTPGLLAFKKKPSEFFLVGSHNILHDEQVRLIPGEQAKVDAKYPGAGLIVDEGELPEWIEITWAHFQATDRKVRLLGKDFGCNYTWTKTYESDELGALRADFGGWNGARGAAAHLWRPGSVDRDLGLAPLVRIPRK